MAEAMTDKARPGGKKESLGQRLPKAESEQGTGSTMAMFSALHDFYRKLSSLLSIPEVREAVVQGTVEVSGADLALFFVRQGNELVCVGRAPADSPHLPELSETHSLGQCLCGLAAGGHVPIYAADIQADPRCTFEECKKAGISSFAALPLVAGQDVLGVLGLASLTPRDFRRQSLFWETMADQAAASLANARLHEQIRENNTYLGEQLKKLNGAQLELKESEDLYRDLVEHAEDLICTHDLSGRILSVNRATEKFLGYDPGDMVSGGSNIRDFLVPEYQQRFDDYVDTIREKGSASGMMVVQTRSGQRRIWEYSNTLRTKGVPEPIVRGLARDITDRERTGDARRISETMFFKAFQSSPVWSAIATVEDGRFLEVNRAFTEITGWSREEIINRTVNDINLWLDTAERDAAIELMGQKGYLHSHPVAWRFKDGSVHDLLWSIEYIAFRGEHCTLSVALDITEQKRAEEKLRNRERELRALFDEALNPIMVLDQKGRYLDANQAALDFWECDRDDLLKRRLWDAMLQNQRDKSNHNQSVFANCRTFENEYVVNGEFKTLLINMVPLDLPGRMIVYGIGQDITERKRLENQLRQSQKLEAMGTLAGGIAHDFNNILAAILGFTEMIREDLPADHATQAHLDQIAQAGRRASDLVRQILSFSRPGDEQQQTLSLTPLIKEAVMLLRSSLPSTIAIQTEFKVRRDTVMADATQMHQVLVNLCTNAAQAINGAGVIRVGLAEAGFPPELESQHLEPGAYLELSVQDSGCGMDQKTRDRIFEPFFTTREVGKGTGMGLAVVHGIVKGHGGVVRVESEPGKGTVFKIYLPAISETEEERPPSEQRRLPGGGERILFVDDEPMLVDIGVKSLRRLGYKVDAFTSSEEALAEFRRRPGEFDVVITDYTMPVLTGADLAQGVIAIRPEMPVILCTGYTESISEQKAREMGITCFLLKPLLPNEIAQILRDVLEGNAPA